MRTSPAPSSSGCSITCRMRAGGRGAASLPSAPGTHASNASRTMLFDIQRGDWDDELLKLLDIPRSVLPKVVASSGRCAEPSVQGVGVPVAGIAGDQQAALFG